MRTRSNADAPSRMSVYGRPSSLKNHPLQWIGTPFFYNSTVRREVKCGKGPAEPEKKGGMTRKRACFLAKMMYNNPQKI